MRSVNWTSSTTTSGPKTAWILLSLGLALTIGPVVEACAILTLHDDATVLMGNNEDWVEPGVIWFVPGKRGRFGRVNVGFRDDFAQGSMNEKGLSFDAAVVPDVDWKSDPSKPSTKNLLEKIMNECATVEEAIAVFETHNCKHLARSQFMFADATGNSAVVAWLPESGLSVERIDGNHQIVTNTRLQPSGYRCQRFTRAEQVLASSRVAVSLDTVAAALESIHQHGPGAFTSYSTVYDLVAKRVFVFNLANFDEVVSFDLNEELAKKPRTLKLAKVFTNSPAITELQQAPQRQEYGTRIVLAEDLLDRYAGIYVPTIAHEVQVRVSRHKDGLRVENPNQPSAFLFPESEVLFRIAPDRGQVTFKVAADGKVEGLTLHKQIDIFAKRVGDVD